MVRSTNKSNPASGLKRERVLMAKLYDIQDTSKILGVSVSAIRKWVIQKRIPFIRIGTLIRFKEEDLIKISQEGLK